ncbi:hypothetical protein LTR70_002272 [Exophiala xenobiotica]|uniref:Nephrocystin 3-like N-terminal domain-containing protein n=1 Tax=Lithohypha guttulata TaxID=1690604 RepID=A0ABR0KL89_9EURO|nr:hypothetical protein LTR24_001306 [Lithohypha guttulata]KAK5326007.1 hypothetical protein LTR70_002272 [Exophiala xenobiotica]
MDPTELAAKRSGRPGPVHPEARRYGDMHIYGNAIVQLGDRYGPDKDLFEEGSEIEKRNALLNVLYYEGLDLRREQLAQTDIGPKSFSWVEHTTFPDWLRSPDTRFWINGKPGSGKSTLMKYLAEGKSTLNRLGINGKQWAVVHFFFDYRAGKSMANQVLGMLKLFIRQLSLVIKQVKEKLQEDVVQQILAEGKIESHVDVLSIMINGAGVEVCAFIDGLDEYDDDLWDLCSRLDEVQDRTGMKLCLASRPERAFEVAFAECPTITMQEHNKSSIEVYMRRKIDKFLSQHLFIEGLFTTELLEAVGEKAQGVILWARLVIDEMIKSCDDSTTTIDLLSFLDRLPSELELLYERILERINQRYQSEAALVLRVLTEHDGNMKATLLFQTWEFLRSHIPQSAKPSSSSIFTASETRIKALLGNMVDLVRPSQKPTSIRLIHRSLSTYLERKDWITCRIPEPLVEMCSDSFGKRLAIDCIKRASVGADIDMDELEGLLHTRVRPPPAWLNLAQLADFDEQSTRTSIPSGMSRNFKQRWSRYFKQRWIKSQQWVRWQNLLLHCIDNFFQYRNEVHSVDPDNGGATLTWPEDSLNLALLHYMRCKQCTSWFPQRWQEALAVRLYRAGAINVLLLLVHSYGEPPFDIIAQHIAKFDHAANQDIFEACLLKHYPKESSKKLLTLFADSNCCFEARHLCYFADSKVWHNGPLSAAKEVTRRRATASTSTEHHRDCPYRDDQTSVMYHWVHLPSLDLDLLLEWLDVAQTVGVDLNASIQKDGMSLLHDVLRQIDNPPPGAEYWTVRQKFIALAKTGLHPTDKRSCKELLDFLEAQLTEAEARIKKSVESRPTDFPRRINWHEQQERNISAPEFLSEVIKAVEYYQEHDTHWPDLEATLPVYRGFHPRAYHLKRSQISWPNFASASYSRTQKLADS